MKWYEFLGWSVAVFVASALGLMLVEFALSTTIKIRDRLRKARADRETGASFRDAIERSVSAIEQTFRDAKEIKGEREPRPPVYGKKEEPDA